MNSILVWRKFILSAVIVSNLMLVESSQVGALDRKITDECVAEAEAIQSYGENLAALDFLASNLGFNGSNSDGEGTCEAPKYAAGCLKCANKGSCKICCVDHYGSVDKKRCGCEKGCESKWPD